MLIPGVRAFVRVLYVDVGWTLDWIVFEGKVWGNVCSANEGEYDMDMVAS